jgi:hypothetical protein
MLVDRYTLSSIKSAKGKIRNEDGGRDKCKEGGSIEGGGGRGHDQPGEGAITSSVRYVVPFSLLQAFCS